MTPVRVIVVSVLMLSLSTQLAATSIIVVRTDVSIFIGADSLRTINRTTSVAACKITRHNNAYVVASGLISYPATGFVLRTFIEAAAAEGGTLASMMARFDNAVRPSLVTLAERLRRDDPEFKERHLDSYFVQVAFVGFENGRPILTQRRYMPKVDERGTLSVAQFACPSNDCAEDVNVLFLGESSAIRSHLESEPHFLLDRNTHPAIRELLAAQIRATPEKVGPPINILYVTKDRSRWLEGGELCGTL